MEGRITEGEWKGITMFHDDQPKIAAWALSCPQNLGATIKFVASTIRVQFTRVKGNLAQIMQGDLGGILPLAKSTVNYVDANMATIWANVQSAMAKKRPQIKARALIKVLISIPGLGIVKAGFVCQLIAGVGGCIDVHNARLYGINLDAFSVQRGLSDKVVDLKVAHYVRMCHQLGTEYLWDNWCSFLSMKYPTSWETPDHVSKYHLECLGI